MSGLACVVNSFTRSAEGGVGNYVVQSLSVSVIQRNLPKLKIITEKREIWADLTKFTVEILSAAPGYKYSFQAILCKIDFVMGESIFHNLNVIKHVFKKMRESKKMHHIHPLRHFQKKIKEKSKTVF